MNLRSHCAVAAVMFILTALLPPGSPCALSVELAASSGGATPRNQALDHIIIVATIVIAFVLTFAML